MTSHSKQGTNAGYQRHKRAGEEPCEECRKAHAEYYAEQRRKKKEKSIDKCGTNAGYQRHLYNDEPPCKLCLKAHRHYHSRYRRENLHKTQNYQRQYHERKRIENHL